ncbi:arylsulfatase [Verrucomicrobia bacterium]|nr:arylsulfatase [Verrucomicrobiota bacterium]
MRILFTLPLVVSCLFGSAGSAAEKPNVLVILADDLGYSDLGCYGGEMPTPNIDALAQGGAKFTQLYNSARCCPSRASLMTGLYPSQAGIGDFTSGKPSSTRGPGYLGRLNDQCVTLAEVLKPAGYATYYVGKWHMHEETGPIKRGFDEFYGYTKGHSHDQYDADYYIRLPEGRAKEIDLAKADYYATDVFNDYAMEFLKQGKQTGKPWFLFLGHSSPHFPVQAPGATANKFDEIYEKGWDALRDERYARMKQIGLVNGEHWNLTPRSLVPVDRTDIANGYEGRPNPAWKDLPEARRRDLARRMAVFAAMVDHMDQGVGRITDYLKKTKQLDNTLILFLSDNGACYEWGPFGFDGKSRTGKTILHQGDDLKKVGQPGSFHSYGSAWANLGNTPFRLYKHFTHEGGISTPFIAHWPKGIGETKDWIRTPAHVMDIMPTIIEATGASYPLKYQGRKITPTEGKSLLPLMKGGSIAARSIGFDHQAAHALRKGDWKIVWGKRMPKEITWELYNIAEDRCEMNDLAKAQPKRVEAMAKEWEQWAKHVQVIWKSDKPVNAQGKNSDLKSPNIKNQEITITARITTSDKTGVIVAQGGNQHGYAIHLIEGRPAFDVRVKGKVTRIMGKQDVPEQFRVKATFTKEAIELYINDQSVAKAPSPGLIPTQPTDPLNKGMDDRLTAGDYSGPNPLEGKITRLKVTTGK